MTTYMIRSKRSWTWRSCVIHNYFIFVSIRFTFDNQYYGTTILYIFTTLRHHLSLIMIIANIAELAWTNRYSDHVNNPIDTKKVDWLPAVELSSQQFCLILKEFKNRYSSWILMGPLHSPFVLTDCCHVERLSEWETFFLSTSSLSSSFRCWQKKILELLKSWRP